MTRRCASCGYELRGDEEWCNVCGSHQPDAAPAPQANNECAGIKKQRMTAGGKIAIAVAAILVICAIAGVLFFLSDSKGLTGTYTYSVSGTNSGGTESYSGTWTLTFDDGRVVDSRRNISTTPLNQSGSGSSDPNSGGVNKYNPGSDRPTPPPAIPYIDDGKVKAKNFMINGAYYGKKYIDTSYGTMYLHEYMATYESVQYVCYCDDNGLMYVLTSGSITYRLIGHRG